MARALVTFATRKRLTSFVGRPVRLRRQAHPAPPSTPCIPPSRPSRSSTTPNGASRKMRRTRRATPASAATASRSPTPPTGGGGRAATRSCGTPGSSPASAVTAPCGWSRPMGKRPSRAQARAERFGWSAWRAPYEARKEGISPEAEGRAAKQALAGCVLMARPSLTGLATSTSRSSHGEWSGTAHQPQQEKSTMNGKINTPRTVCKAMFRAETIGRKLESFCGSS